MSVCWCSYGKIVPVHMEWTEDPATTVTFSWERNVAGRGTVVYGVTTNYQFSVSDSGGIRHHTITLRHLIPGQRYHYQVSSTDGFSMEDRTFRAAPDYTGSINFVAYGDSQSGGGEQTGHRGVVAQMTNSHPDFIINVGDFADEAGHPGDWSVWDTYCMVVTGIFESCINIPSAGNHENPNDPNAFYWRIFNFPTRPSAGRYYSLDVGNMHFVSLFSESDIEAQMAWLTRDLQAAAYNTNITWIIPFFHRPPYTKGNHGPNETIKTNWCPIFVQYGVDMVFNGHNHSYERTVPIRGIPYVITGGGGASLYSVEYEPDFHAAVTACYHYTSMQVTGAVMQYQAIRSDGLIFDQNTFSNQGAAVRVAPAFPLRGESVKITYNAAIGPLFYSDPLYILLGIDAFTNSLVDAPMTYNAVSELWEYTYVVPTTATQRLAFVFHDFAATNWDNNYTYDWQALLGQVKVLPEILMAGSNVTIRYDDLPGPILGSAQVYAHVGFNDWTETLPVDLTLTNAGSGIWEYTFQLPLYADKLDLAFRNDTTWDSQEGINWQVKVQHASRPSPWKPLPLVVEGSVLITENPAGQNNPGDNVDLDLSGTALYAKNVSSGFGDFGEIYFNYDATNLYIGGMGLDSGGTNNVPILFLGFDTLGDNALNLWHKDSLPNALNELHNVGFTEPMDIAVILGDEYADRATYTNFTYGGYDFGQGVWYLATNNAVFYSMANAQLSQFDGTGTTACITDDDDGNRQTDRWELALPWASLDATGVDDIHHILVAGIIGSDSVTNHNRYLSSTYIGEKAFGEYDAFGNYGSSFVNLRPVRVVLGHEDDDMDGLPNRWEHRNFGSVRGPGKLDDDDTDGMDNWSEYLSGTEPTNAFSLFQVESAVHAGSGNMLTWENKADRIYSVYRSLSMQTPFLPFVTNLTGNTYTDTNEYPDHVYYQLRLRVEE